MTTRHRGSPKPLPRAAQDCERERAHWALTQESLSSDAIKTAHWYFISGLDVMADESTAAVAKIATPAFEMLVERKAFA